MLSRRKWRVRLLAFSMIFFIFLFYVIIRIKSSYLYLVFRGLTTSSSLSPSSPIISWEIPDFVYYNNQLLLHFGMIAYMPDNTQFLSPDIRIPSLDRTNTNFLPIYDVFDRNQLTKLHVFDQTILVEKNQHIFSTGYVHVALDWLAKPTMNSNNKHTKIINITIAQDGKRTDDLWKIIFARLILRVFFLNKKNDITYVARSFRYINSVQSCVSSLLTKHPKLTQAIGIYLRTWTVDISIGQTAIHIHEYNPLHLFFRCQLSSHSDLSVIISNIERIQLSKDQPIYLATDNDESPLVIELKNRYINRTLNINEPCFKDNILFPMIQNELLTQTQSFLGSFFSTFSIVVALRRDLAQTYFIQTTMQFYFYRYISIIFIICLLVYCFCFIKILRRFYLRI